MKNLHGPFSIRPSRLTAQLFLPAFFIFLGWLGLQGCAFGQGATETILHNFSGSPSDGATSLAGLVRGTDGNFYGTTLEGGSDNKGTVFRMTPSGTVTILHSFTGIPDGASPRAALVIGIDGNFYGTTTNGGVGDSNDNYGTIFQVTPSGTYTIIHKFEDNSNGIDDGCNPVSGVVQGSDGSLYGSTSTGLSNSGTLFKITLSPPYTFTVLYSFGGSGPYECCASLIQGSDGAFYGTTVESGSSGAGTVFRYTSGITPTFTVLHTFEGGANDGSYPYSPVVQGSDGDFYGTTTAGGTSNKGTVFKMSPDGSSYTVLHSFTDNPDGADPQAGLIQGLNGTFYGTTSRGGVDRTVGSVFSITAQGALTILYTFEQPGSTNDGANPMGGLIQVGNGNLYGTTSQGAAGDQFGTVFEITLPTTPLPENTPAMPLGALAALALILAFVAARTVPKRIIK